MNPFLDLNGLLRATPQESEPHGRIQEMARALLGPKLHTDVSDGYCVGQGDAAISRHTLFTGGLVTCTAIVMASATHNFVCHVDSVSKPEWIAECIRTFIKVGGQPVEIARFNCHGKGLSEPAEQNSREALLRTGLFDKCADVQYGITMMHTVGAKEPGAHASRVFSLFGHLKAA